MSKTIPVLNVFNQKKEYGICYRGGNCCNHHRLYSIYYQESIPLKMPPFFKGGIRGITVL